MAVPRRFAGNTWKTVTITSGCTTPEAKPWITRPAMMKSSVGPSAAMRPPAKNSAMTMRKVCRWPKRATNQAFSSWLAVMATMKPVVSSCARSWPTP